MLRNIRIEGHFPLISPFREYKQNDSKNTNNALTGTKQYITSNKINKKTKKNESNSHNTYIKVLNVNTLLLTLISSPAFNVATCVAVFTTPFEWSNSNVSRLFC